MKNYVLIVLLLMVNASWSQTIVFEKNKEIAIFNARKGTSTIETSTVFFITELTADKLTTIGEVLGEKDGYIEIERLNNAELRVQFESWINLNDLYRILRFHGFQLKHEIEEKEEQTNE